MEMRVRSMWVTFRLYTQANKSIQLYFGITLLVCLSESRVLGRRLQLHQVVGYGNRVELLNVRHGLHITTRPTSAPNI